MPKKVLTYLSSLAIFSFIMLFIADFLVMPFYVRMGSGKYMVNVIGKELSYGKKILKEENFKPIVSDTLFSAVYKPGEIVDQYPEPNRRVKDGRTVRLKIAQPEKMVTLPDLIGRSLRSAELTLMQSGLEIDTVYKEYNSDVPEGNVTWQYPRGGDLLSKGMGLHLTISLGVPPNFFQVPNLFGLSKKKAIADLEKAGLTLGKVFYRQNEDLIPYTVLDQSISAETVLEKTTQINLTVSVLDMQDIFNQMIDR